MVKIEVLLEQDTLRVYLIVYPYYSPHERRKVDIRTDSAFK